MLCLLLCLFIYIFNHLFIYVFYYYEIFVSSNQAEDCFLNNKHKRVGKCIIKKYVFLLYCFVKVEFVKEHDLFNFCFSICEKQFAFKYEPELPTVKLWSCLIFTGIFSHFSMRLSRLSFSWAFNIKIYKKRSSKLLHITGGKINI